MARPKSKWLRVCTLSCGFLACVAFVSCRRSLPFFEDAVSHFRKHRSEIIEVRNGLLNSDFVEFHHGGLSGSIVARISFGGPEVAISSDKGAALRESLERAQVIGANLDGEDVYIDLLAQDRHEKFYLLKYHYRMSGFRDLKNCAEISDQLKCGWCSAPIENHWSVEVRWFPSVDEESPSPECVIGTVTEPTRSVAD